MQTPQIESLISYLLKTTDFVQDDQAYHDQVYWSGCTFQFVPCCNFEISRQAVKQAKWKISDQVSYNWAPNALPK